jgi:hypothetical protein
MEKIKGAAKAHFPFLPGADRSTMAHSRMAAKIGGYVNCLQQKLYQRKYPGMRFFQVAAVTETRLRAGSHGTVG